MEVISVISIGALFGIYTSLDLFFVTHKKGKFFTKHLIILLTSSIPLIVSRLLLQVDNKTTIYDNWFKYFYVSWIFTFILICLFVYLFYVKKLNTKKTWSTNFVKISFLDYIFDGHSTFVEKLIEYEEKYSDILKNESESFFKINKDLGKEIRKFISTTYILVNKNDVSFDKFTYTTIFTFVHIFFGSASARFSLRKLNENNEMVTYLSTGNEAGNIPLDVKNMISRSFELDEPAIYSRNIEFHYSTSNNGMKKGVYEDYVSYCIIKSSDGRTPLYSLSLDCKGENQVKKLKALVDSQFFSVICGAIEEKYNKEVNK